MYKILSKSMLSDSVCMIQVAAPMIAKERQPGQFILLSIETDYGERIPLTIADADPVAGSITLIFQLVGHTTRALAQLEVGESLAYLVGPLGQPTHLERFGHVVCVGGGIGVAPLYPIVQGLKKLGNTVSVIMGARNRSLLILEDWMRQTADQLIICTDDGSAGHKAVVTAPLLELCSVDPKPDLVIAIGPPIMMKFCAETTRPFQIHTLVSLNSIMVDGTGMCGGCRVTVGGKTRFVCVDGPEFDGHQVDFDNLMQRLSAYKTQENAHRDGSPCQLQAQLDIRSSSRN